MRRLGADPAEERDEAKLLAVLARAGLSVAPTVLFEEGDGEDGVGAALAAIDAGASHACGVLVRTSQPASSPFTAVVAQASAPLAFAREAAATVAEVVGVPAARFLAGAPLDSRETLDAALSATVLRVAREPWPVDLEARVAFLIGRARKRQAGALVMLQRLDEATLHGVAASRDTRTGGGPVRVSCSKGPLALADGPSSPRPLAEVTELSGARESLELAAGQLEAEARAVTRFTFAVGASGTTFVSVAPQRRTARSACVLAADLAASGALEAGEALSLVDPSELAACFSARVDAKTTTPATSGVAAGGGIARGRAAFSTARALELELAKVAPVLVVPEVEPEDAGAVRAAAGIVVLRGGITGEAAIMARALGKPCVAAGGIVRRHPGEPPSSAPGAVEELRVLTVDGGAGRVFAGALVLEPADTPPEAVALLALAEGDTPAVVHAMVSCEEDVETAARFGAERVVVWNLEEVMFDALLDAGDPGDALAARLDAIVAAASRIGLPVAVRVSEPSPELLRAAGCDARAGASLVSGTRRALLATGSIVEVVVESGGPWPLPVGAAASVADPTDAQGGRAWARLGSGSAHEVSVVADAKRLSAASEGGALEIACPPTLVPAARFALARRRRVYRPPPA